MADEREQDSGNGDYRQSRTTILEVALGVLRERVNALAKMFDEHVITVNREDSAWRTKTEERLDAIEEYIQSAEPERGWEILNEHSRQLDVINQRHLKEDIQAAWILREWRTVGGAITFFISLYDALMHLKVI